MIMVKYRNAYLKKVIMCEHVGITEEKIVCYSHNHEYVIMRVENDKVEVA